MQTQKNNKLLPILWSLVGTLLVGILVARAVFPEHLWVTIATSVAFIGVLGALINENRRALRTRQAAFGINSVVTTILVIAIVGVINFMASRYPGKLDLTKNKVHTLSEQTIKLVKGLQKPVQAVFYQPVAQAGPAKSLLENMKGLNTKFELEFVDPNKEPTRAKQNSIKKLGSLQLITTGPQGGNKEEKIEDPTEEKITNALLKLLKEKNPILCAVTGHGERSFTSQEADGFEASRKSLQNQNYDIKDLQLSQESKIDPEKCNAVAILGPTRAFFEKEIQLLDEYLANGGRAVVTLDIDLKGGENSSELQKLLSKWYVKVDRALVVDPFARLAGSDAAVPVTRNYSKDNAITKEMQIQTYFPLSRPLEAVSGAPAGLNVTAIVKTNDAAWGETDFASLAKGQVKNDKGIDKPGPLTVAVAVDGKQKDSKAPRNTRLVVFGSSNFAANVYSRFGANLDLFANSISWVLEDENLISIRAKEDGPSKIELSQKQGSLIFIITVIILPLAIAVAGIVIWVRRRKL